MKIRKLVRTGAASLVAVLLIGGVLASNRINLIRIGGPMQIQMQQASDLVADILPPPEYVLEPYLEATLLMRQPGEYEVRSKRLAQLRKDYDTRHAYWLSSNFDPALRSSVTQGSHAPAQKFWTELYGSFFASHQGARHRRNGRQLSASRCRLR